MTITRLTPSGIPGRRSVFRVKTPYTPRRITTLRPSGVPGAWYGDIRAARSFSALARAYAIQGEERRRAIVGEDRSIAINEDA